MQENALSSYGYDAYLALENDAEVKYEYHDGQIIAMAGGSPQHGLISVNFITATNLALQQQAQTCRIFSSDVKIRIDATNRTYYPDASIVCGPFEVSEKDKNAIVNPILILEVLSESTEAFDRGAKFAHYRKLPSFREYILIHQEQVMIDTYYKHGEGLWDIRTFTELADVVHLKSIDCKVNVSDIYRLVPGIGG